MTLFCPSCNTAIDGSAAAGLLEMNCPQCGIRFSVPEPALADAARWGEVTTSRLAIISLLAGVGSLVLPFCLCPFLLVGWTTAAAPPGAIGVGVAPPRPVPVVTATAVPGAPVPTPPSEPTQPAEPDDSGEGGD